MKKGVVITAAGTYIMDKDHDLYVLYSRKSCYGEWGVYIYS